MSRGFAERHPEAQDSVSNPRGSTYILPERHFWLQPTLTRKRVGPRVNRLGFTTMKLFLRRVHDGMWRVGQMATGVILFDDTVWQWWKTLGVLLSFFFFFLQNWFMWQRFSNFLAIAISDSRGAEGGGVRRDVDNSLVPPVRRGYLNIILNRKVNKHAMLFMRRIIWDKSAYCETAVAVAAAEPRNGDTAVCNQHNSP